MTITVSAESHETVTVALAGVVSGVGIGELRREIDRAHRIRKRVEIDLGEITLIDRHSTAFLAEQSRSGVILANCPIYIERWIQETPPIKGTLSNETVSGEAA